MAKQGDLVWAKLKYCPFWPAKVVEAPPELKKPKGKICVLFFGSKNFAFLDGEFVVDYMQNREKYVKKGRGIDFKDAVARMDEYIADPVKYAENACVKPNKSCTLNIKRERPPMVKQEKETSPFEVSEVYVGPKNDAAQADCDLQSKIALLSQEKSKLIEELIATKTENQKLYIDVKAKDQMIASQLSEKDRLTNESSEQQKIILNLNREKCTLQAKIKQLMANASAHYTSDEHEIETAEEFEVEKVLDHKMERMFFIRWKNYSPQHDSWERESNLNCSKILAKYLKTKGNKF